MKEEFKAAYINGLSACLIAKVLGMFSENILRYSKGETMAYTEQQFQDAIDLSGVHHNAMMELYQRY